MRHGLANTLRWQAKQKEKGLCIFCVRKAFANSSRCLVCLIKQANCKRKIALDKKARMD